jgi:hypothetical protein
MRWRPTRDTGRATAARYAEAFVPLSFASGEGHQFDWAIVLDSVRILR